MRKYKQSEGEARRMIEMKPRRQFHWHNRGPTRAIYRDQQGVPRLYALLAQCDRMRSSTGPGQLKDSEVDLDGQGGRHEEWRARYGSYQRGRVLHCRILAVGVGREVRAERMGLEEVGVNHGEYGRAIVDKYQSNSVPTYLLSVMSGQHSPHPCGNRSPLEGGF